MLPGVNWNSRNWATMLIFGYKQQIVLSYIHSSIKWKTTSKNCVSFFYILIHTHAYEPTILFLASYSKEMKSTVHKKTQVGLILTSKKLETQMSINRRKDKLWHMHPMKYDSAIKEKL